MGKYVSAIFGFIAGVVTIPAGMVFWPFLLAWFFYNDQED